jgi:hypothetical protein
MKEMELDVALNTGLKNDKKNKLRNYANTWGALHEHNLANTNNIGTVIGQIAHALLLKKLQNQASKEDDDNQIIKQQNLEKYFATKRADKETDQKNQLEIIAQKLANDKRVNAERDAIKEARRREEEERKNNAQIEKEQREAAQKQKEERIKLIAKGFKNPADALKFLDDPKKFSGKIATVDGRSVGGKLLGMVGLSKPKRQFVIKD